MGQGNVGSVWLWWNTENSKVLEDMRETYKKLQRNYKENWAKHLALGRLGVLWALNVDKRTEQSCINKIYIADRGKKLLVRTWVLWFLFWFIAWDSERGNQTVDEAEYIAFNINIADCIWSTQMVLRRRQELLLLRSTIYFKISTNYIVWLKTVPLNLHDWMIL